jgi:hypothetical protein
LAQKLISHHVEFSKHAETDSIANIIATNDASLQKTPQQPREIMSS